MKKQKWLGGFLNMMLPGLGFLYSQQVIKAIGSYLLSLISILLIRFIGWNFIFFVLAAFIAVGYYVIIIILGYRAVEKEKVYPSRWYDKLPVLIGVILTLNLSLLLIPKGTLDSFTTINYARIPTVSMSPALRVGDIMAFERTHKIEAGDITVFRYPHEETMYVSRCIGRSGDSVVVRRGVVFVNGISLSEATPMKHRYLVETTDVGISQLMIAKLELDNPIAIGSNFYLTDLTPKQASDLKTLPFIKSVVIRFAEEGDPDPLICEGKESCVWNADYYGPIYVPRKGDKIVISKETIELYKSIIAYENDVLSSKDDQLFIDGHPVKSYVFKEDYFFLMSDNRSNAIDSRFKGLIPESRVVGKGLFLRWSDMFERIGEDLTTE
jgi:signal peptidase I